ncbi:hypothetical protein [Xanthomonas translucens]|uniref:hypothetical protein n=1 Tax=Xanthomonas campestris pv. translucens TaxID=343 RepID=UPI00271211C1|nr:hypothetical protein [Xanthomonas translucens]WLA05626.1 hypothetical protein MO329_04740 [Xanthomonas translucens]
MVSADAYQAARRRKHTAIKDREPTAFPCILVGDADADALMLMLMPNSLARSRSTAPPL